MKTAYAFLKKEWMEYLRTGKLYLCGAIFLLLGIMNPATAKLTPFILETFAGEDSGMQIIMGEVTAADSWTQFYKNIPMGLIICLLLFGGVLTNELQKGTLIPILTKGLSRWKVLFTKGISLVIIWSLGYWLCFGVTYFYTDYYWDNSVMSHIVFAATCYWLFGAFIMSLLVFFSSVVSSFGGLVVCVGIVYFLMVLVSIAPKLAEYLPTYLSGAGALLSGGEIADYGKGIAVTSIGTVMAFVFGCFIFNKREI